MTISRNPSSGDHLQKRQRRWHRVHAVIPAATPSFVIMDTTGSHTDAQTVTTRRHTTIATLTESYASREYST